MRYAIIFYNIQWPNPLRNTNFFVTGIALKFSIFVFSLLNSHSIILHVNKNIGKK